MLDLSIVDALIFDGGGGKPYRGALGVRDGRIVSMGDAEPARETVRADGLAVAPGIIDPHTHYDAQLTWDPGADPSPSLGVTTVVIGNCGFTIAPCRAEDRDLTMRNLTEVEGMSLEALRAGIAWDFETFPQYLDMLAKRGVVPNVAAFVGHSSVRLYVMGADSTRRAANDGEIAQMAKIIEEAMAAGAIGFATSTAPQHNGADGIPMPSRLADDREMRALVCAMGKGGRGIFMLTRGPETSVPYLESIAAESGRPIMMAGVMYREFDPEAGVETMRELASARKNGHLIYGQTSCQPLTMEFTLDSPYPLGSLATFKPALVADRNGKAQLYAQPEFRAALRAEVADIVANRRRSMFYGQWDRIAIIQANAEHRSYENQSVADLAQREGKDPLDFFFDLALSEGLHTTYSAALLNADEAGVGKLLVDPMGSIGLSDAGAHLTFLCDAGFGLHLLGHWVRDLGVMPLEHAVHLLTGHPASVYGFYDRGRLQPGAAADLILFDPKTVGRGPTRRVHDLPSGAPRLSRSPLGLHGVWINGARVLDDRGSGLRDGRTGKIIREFRTEAPTTA